MNKILIAYASMTGNTKFVAVQIYKGLQNKPDSELTIKKVHELEPNDFNNYDIVILGSSTWDEGKVHFQLDEYQHKLGEITFPDKKIAYFGCGDSTYVHFCEGINKMEEFFNAKGCTQICPSLRIDGFADTDANCDRIEEWVRQLSV